MAGDSRKGNLWCYNYQLTLIPKFSRLIRSQSMAKGYDTDEVEEAEDEDYDMAGDDWLMNKEMEERVGEGDKIAGNSAAEDKMAISEADKTTISEGDRIAGVVRELHGEIEKLKKESLLNEKEGLLNEKEGFLKLERIIKSSIDELGHDIRNSIEITLRSAIDK
ncbi:hypothetical protein COLO4_09726 [Corchorus olitorius]|uniref:Uncharacterized protein n=1 Tax=Corchorus olitorius TaxID=93759 RepID=A0A1R3KB87_9ROSI|nr:hypothetical protein COLO4_09726 [Corchorus olitorius]